MLVSSTIAKNLLQNPASLVFIFPPYFVISDTPKTFRKGLDSTTPECKCDDPYNEKKTSEYSYGNEKCERLLRDKNTYKK